MTGTPRVQPVMTHSFPPRRFSGLPMRDVTSLLRFYWLDIDGIQRSDSLLGARAGRPRFAMLLDQPGADASGRGFFARAVANPDSVQRSRAYLQRGFGDRKSTRLNSSH